MASVSFSSRSRTRRFSLTSVRAAFSRYFRALQCNALSDSERFRDRRDLRVQIRQRLPKLLLVSWVLARLEFSFNSCSRQPQHVAPPPRIELLGSELRFLALTLVIAPFRFLYLVLD